MNMVSVNTVLDYLWTIAPKDAKEPWDNVGHLVGRGDASVSKILVTLDVTMPVIQEAAEVGAELIVSHHPLIWDTYKHVTDRVYQQEKVMTLIENRTAAICMHTNLDESEDGVDDTLERAAWDISVNFRIPCRCRIFWQWSKRNSRPMACGIATQADRSSELPQDAVPAENIWNTQ